jgi:hypothetical protein
MPPAGTSTDAPALPGSHDGIPEAAATTVKVPGRLIRLICYSLSMVMSLNP